MKPLVCTSVIHNSRPF
uniref:Uncharacterized protein n=1 Tax=Arundo donax TaxID=35708 RepID=A0A0A8ZZI4_ARUDO